MARAADTSDRVDPGVRHRRDHVGDRRHARQVEVGDVAAPPVRNLGSSVRTTGWPKSMDGT
jgi:hypothetical protein